MKTSDLLQTSSQRSDMTERLARTEKTDAVNSGLVGKADKSEGSLKGALYTQGSKHANSYASRSAQSAARAKKNTGNMSDTSQDVYTSGTKGKSAGAAGDKSVQTEIQSKHHLKDALNKKNLAKGGAGKAVHSTLQDTELEGADDLYYEGKAAAKGIKKIRNRLAGKNALEGKKTLGKLSEKAYQKKAAEKGAAAASKAQMKNYFTHAVYANKQAAAASTAAKGAGIIGNLFTAVASKFAAVAGALSAPLLGGIVVIVLAISIITAITTGSVSQSISYDNLNATEAEIAQTLKGYGFTNEAIAAVLGNMKQESGVNPNCDSDDGYGTISLGLVQMTGYERTAFKHWCSVNGKAWNSAAVQCEWVFSNKSGTSTGYYMNRWMTGLAAHYYEQDTGFESYFGTDYYRSADSFKGSTDVKLATYSWMACYERPGSRKSYGDDVSRLNKRLTYAAEYLAALNSSGGATYAGGGEEYAKAAQWQKNIVNSACSVGSPGGGLCAMWVSLVYQNAGLGYPGGNGNSMLSGYATSSDFSKIKVGQIISAQYGSNTWAGNTYGHVCIYIGDGKVMDNIGYIRTTSLSEWLSDYSRGWVKYGWPW